jgi:L-histidine N-alpha-methyltransferase
MSRALTIEVHLSRHAWRAELLADLAVGLSASPRHLSPVWFYDTEGSRLFDEITRLDEYYPTRAERDILRSHAHDIVEIAQADTLVELGSGTSEKTTLLLDAMAAGRVALRYAPLDLSEATVRQAAETLMARYPGLSVHAVIGDFRRHLGHLPGGGRRLVAFLGGTIGNLVPEERRTFLGEVRAVLRPGEHFLVGVDLVKDPRRLVAAYDDAAGVTAAFNRNALVHLNREVGADFDPERFDHVALWDPARSWIEMRLRSRVAQRVHLVELEIAVELAPGEEVRTEISAKFTTEGIVGEVEAAGFEVTGRWGAEQGDFLVLLAAAR